MGYRVPYAFLFDVSNRFKATFGERIYTSGSMGLNDAFARVLQERMDYYSNDKTADKINKVKGEIEEAKNVMVKNIDKVLERGSKIEELVDKTDMLQEQAHSFKRKGTKLKRKMWWKNAKLCCILICILIIVIVAITIGVLWYTGVLQKLVHHKSNNNGTTTTSGTSTTGLISSTTALLTTGIIPPVTTATTGTTGIHTTGVHTTGLYTTGTTGTTGIQTTGLHTTGTTDASTTEATTTDNATTAASTTGDVTTTGVGTTGTTGQPPISTN